MNLDGVLVATVELGTVERAFVAARNPNLRPAFAESRKPIRADMRAHAKAQQGPGGSVWPGRASSTRARAQSRRNRRPRKLLGRLPGALSITVDPRRALVKSQVAWSAVQRDGGVAGNGARIPARDWLWASDALLATVSESISKLVAKIAEGG